MHLVAALLVMGGWFTTNHFSPWVSWHAELPFFALALLASVRGAFFRAGSDRMHFPAAAGWSVLFVGMVGVQYANGLVPWIGQVVVALLYGLLAAAFMQWGWQEAMGRRATTDSADAAGEWLAWTLVVGGLASMAIAWVQVLDVWEGASFITRQSQLRRPGANMGQANHLATLLVMAMSATLFLNLLGRLSALTVSLILFLLAAGVAVTESRTGLLAAAALCLLWAWKRPHVDHGLPRAFAGAMAMSMVSLFAAWPALYSLWSGGLASAADATERMGSTSSDPRWVLWNQVFDATLLKPWAGWGFRNTAEAHNAISHQDVTTLPITYSHNVVLDLAVWFGWPLALVFSLVVLAWACNRFLWIQQSSSAWFGFALFLPFAIHCLLEFPFAYAYLLMPAIVGIGLIEGALRPNQRTLQIRTPWIRLSVLAGAALAIWSVIDYLRVEEDFRVARFQMLRIGPPSDALPPNIVLLDQLGDMVASTRVPMQAGLDAAQIDLLRKAAVHNPWSGSQYRYATALALNDQADEARRQMQVLRAQHGFKVYRALAEQLEKNLSSQGKPPLGLPLEAGG